MVKVHVVLVGTELLNRIVELTQGKVAEKLATWASAKPLSEEDKKASDEADLRGEAFTAMLLKLKEEPSVSEEVPAIIRYVKAAELDHLYLFSRATGVGRLCANVLAEFLAGEGVKADVRVIKGLGVDFELGVSSLIDAFAWLTRKHRNDVLYLGVPASLAAEGVVAAVCASLAGFERLYYIRAGQATELPVFPVALKSEYVQTLKWMLEYEIRYGYVPVEEAKLKLWAKTLSELLRRDLVYEDGRKLKLRRWTKSLLRSGF